MSKKASNRVPIKEEDTDGLSMILQASSISLGHWVPEDSGLHFLNESADQHCHDDHEYEFLEEFTGFQCSQVRLDLRRRILQIKRKHQDTIEINDIILSLAELRLGPKESYDTITFRLKDIETSIDLGYDAAKSDYSLLFSCKQPPKLHKVTIRDNYFDQSERLTNICDAPFGRCLGFKISCQKTQFEKLFGRDYDFLMRLKDFGMMSAGNVSDAIHFKTTRIEYNSSGKDILEKAMCNITDRKSGTSILIISPCSSLFKGPTSFIIYCPSALLTRSVIDKGQVISWFDALNDYVSLNKKHVNMFDLIEEGDFDIIRPVSKGICYNYQHYKLN